MIAGWLLIGVLVILILLVIFKSQDLVFLFILIKKYMFFGVSLVIILFLVFSLYSINANNKIDLTSFKGIMEVGKIYFVWFKGFIGNVGNIAGNVVNQDWFPSKNVTVGT